MPAPLGYRRLILSPKKRGFAISTELTQETGLQSARRFTERLVSSTDFQSSQGSASESEYRPSQALVAG